MLGKIVGKFVIIAFVVGENMRFRDQTGSPVQAARGNGHVSGIPVVIKQAGATFMTKSTAGFLR